jgi:mRNA (guanine-N7-)-methyltransferase
MQFDIVSCQFALHYSFENESRARMFARNIAERLKPGGTFVATFPSADVLQRKLDATVQMQRQRSAQRMAQMAAAAKPEEPRPLRLEFGNSVYKVKFTSPCPLVFEQNEAAQAAAKAVATAASSSSSSSPLPPPVPPLPSSPFGVQYTFDLTDAIAECPEYMVPLPTLCALLAEHDCELVLCSSMHQFFLEHASHDEYGRLLKQMKVLGSEYERPPTRDEWEVLNVYLAVAFRKRMPQEAPGAHPDVALAAHAPATSGLQRPPPPATPWQNLTHQDAHNMQLHRLAHADIKIIKPPPHAPAAANCAAAAAAK